MLGRAGVMAMIGLSLAGCAGETRFGTAPNESAAFSAVAGPPDGSPPGRASNRIAAPVSSAAIGRLLGNRIGAALDDEDRKRAYVAQMQALDNGLPGAPVGWNNENSGRHGTVVPGPTYERNAMTCRQYTHTIFVDAKPEVARGTACRSPDGTWSAVS
jgi:surface antigen